MLNPSIPPSACCRTLASVDATPPLPACGERVGVRGEAIRAIGLSGYSPRSLILTFSPRAGRRDKNRLHLILTRSRDAAARAGVLLAPSFALLALLALAGGAALAAADPAQGEKLAKRWCAACHIVSPEQTRGADNVPAFAAIAQRPGFSAEKIARFLMNPHPKMPDMQLTRSEAADLGAYIASLAK